MGFNKGALCVAIIPVIVIVFGRLLGEYINDVQPIVDWDACWTVAACGGRSEYVVKSSPFSVEQEELLSMSKMLGNRKPVHGLDGFETEDWEYGIDKTWLESVLVYWEKEYDWRKIETKMNNDFSPKEVTIDGLKIHFLHIQPSKQQGQQTRIPILLLHGWPGSVYEFHKFIPALVESKPHLPYEIIVPSLPGYGFSSGAEKPGLDVCAAAVIMSKLMTQALKHEHYFVQGGDWGSVIAHCLVQIVPQGQVLGTHVNMPLAPHTWWSFPYAALFESDLSERKKSYPISGFLSGVVSNLAYMQEHMTKPSTIGFVIAQAPAATAAWILEKFHGWSDCSNSKLTNEELVTNLMFYWLTGSQVSSIRLYKETLWGEKSLTNLRAVLVKRLDSPFGISLFPHEMLPPPKIVLSSRYTNIVTLEQADKGGHFAAFEQPNTLAGHFNRFVLKSLEGLGAQHPLGSVLLT
mmetsp:Transcript_29298/g.47048  ORF Transcript_29298/g.47048 Transcript_29298/m.47048 type:complete len:463 (+) Transcript_29298:137-1525(+)